MKLKGTGHADSADFSTKKPFFVFGFCAPQMRVNVFNFVWKSRGNKGPQLTAD
jgi:hypothetical protein